MSEEYRFLRYYIPGSLFLIYLSGLILANSNERVMQYLSTISILQILGAFIGFFAISPPIGYMIYQIYDWTMYRRLAMCREKRKTLQLIDDWAKEEEVTLEDVKKKELIDFAFYFSLKESNFKMSDQIGEIIRRFWSHVNARLVCSIYVPSFSLLFFFLVLIPITNVILAWDIFTLDLLKTVLILFYVVIFSVFLGYPALETMKEAFALEESVVRIRESEIRVYIKKLKPKKTSNSTSRKIPK